MADKDYNIDINSEDKFEINIEDATYTLEINPTDTFEIQLNEQGPQGDTGNGIDHIELIEESEEYNKYRIVYTNGEYYDYIVYNGINLYPAEVYVHEQQTPQSVWNIKHNLGTYPSITVIDTSGSVVWGSYNYINDNEIEISFSAPFGGKAYLNYTR